MKIVGYLFGILVPLAGPLSAAEQYPILSECDPSADVRARVSQDASLEIHYSISGAPACYSVTALVDGKQIRGYLLDGPLDAIREFEKARTETEREAFRANPMPPPPPPAPPIAVPDSPAAKTAPKDPPRPQQPVYPKGRDR